MVVLIVEDEFITRRLLTHYFNKNATCDIAINGEEAVLAVKIALEEGTPYDLICLDVMMPKLDGYDTLKEIRALEAKAGIDILNGQKVIMITAVSDGSSVMEAFRELCDGYVIKPITKDKVDKELARLNILL